MSDLTITATYEDGAYTVRIPEVLGHFIIWGGPRRGVEYAENALRDAIISVEDDLDEQQYHDMMDRLGKFLNGLESKG